jgi:hypothetical protein
MAARPRRWGIEGKRHSCPDCPGQSQGLRSPHSPLGHELNLEVARQEAYSAWYVIKVMCGPRDEPICHAITGASDRDKLFRSLEEYGFTSEERSNLYEKALSALHEPPRQGAVQSRRIRTCTGHRSGMIPEWVPVKVPVV